MRLECPAGDVVARSSGAEQRAAVCYSKEAMTRVEVKVARSGSKRIFANSRQVSRGHPWRTPSYIEISVALLLLRTSSLYIDPTAVEAAVARQQLWNSGTSYGQTHVKPKIQRRGHGEQGTPAFSERRYLKNLSVNNIYLRRHTPEADDGRGEHSEREIRSMHLFVAD